ncbi:MAG: Cysteine desulfurase [Chlamydiia bacterium]|nr:Cysteine desulfurase [Chlamydiia bacterium]
MVDFPIDLIRSDFPILAKKSKAGRPLIYFDSASTTLKPRRVVETISNFYLYEYGTVNRAVYELAANATECYANAREKVQIFINAASEDEIIFTRGTTDSINLLAHSFAKAFIEEGDEIIISEVEHHSNIVPWQLLAEEKKIEIKIVPVNDRGEFDLNAYRNLLTDKTKLVSCAYVTNTTGIEYPVKEIISLAHHTKAKVLLDAAQAPAHVKIDVQDLDVDFLAFSSHKMYGPTGIGVLYGKKALLEAMPPRDGGGDMIERVTLEESTFQKPPLRFEAGTPLIAQVIGLGAAVDYINEIGLQKIKAHEETLMSTARKELSTIEGISFLGAPEKGGAILTFVIKGVHSLDLGTILNLKGVAMRTGQLCAEPTMDRFGISTATRISFGIYNTVEEVKHFASLLKEALLMLKPQMAY